MSEPEAAATDATDALLGPNCLLAVCCPPRSKEQKAAIARAICAHFGWPDARYDEAFKIADWIAESFDLAPAGSLVDLKRIIAKLARENQ